MNSAICLLSFRKEAYSIQLVPRWTQIRSRQRKSTPCTNCMKAENNERIVHVCDCGRLFSVGLSMLSLWLLLCAPLFNCATLSTVKLRENHLELWMRRKCFRTEAWNDALRTKHFICEVRTLRQKKLHNTPDAHLFHEFSKISYCCRRSFRSAHSACIIYTSIHYWATGKYSAAANRWTEPKWVCHYIWIQFKRAHSIYTKYVWKQICISIYVYTII